MFSVKAPKAITHFKQFNDTERMVSDFYGTIKEGLKHKLGCVLFQLPPKASYTEERLEKILLNLDPEFNNVLEFRNTSWWIPEVYNALSKNNISFCGMSHPNFSTELITNISTVYYRFHGIPELYKSSYSYEDLEQFANDLYSSKQTKRAFIYFNNDIGGSAIQNSKTLIEILQQNEKLKTV